MRNWPSSKALISIFKHYSFVCVSLFSKLHLAADRGLENMSSTPGPSWRTKRNQFACNRGEYKKGGEHKKATRWFFIFAYPTKATRANFSEAPHQK